MTDNTADNKTQVGNNPLEQGKKTIAEMFEEYKKQLMILTFISTFVIKNKSNEYRLPKQNKFLFQQWNRLYMLEIKQNKIIISLKTTFVVENVKECTLIYNDKSGKKPLKYYLVTLKNSSGKIEYDVEIANNSKSDYKQFQAEINSRYNNFTVNMSESEFKTFIAEFISPKVAQNALIYTNAGVLEQGKILYENALATKDGIMWADENGYIKTDKNTYIKLTESTHYLPKLTKSCKTGKEIAHELMTNIVECWSDDMVLPLMALGHMIMSIFFEDFVKRFGVPTLILYGATGTGKSTLATVGLSIFGLSRDALTSGGSTAKSNEYFASKYNGMNICIDDVKGATLNSSNFSALVKGAYKAISRTRMLPYGKGVEYINICSPMAYSTNEPLPKLHEIVNRMNIIEMFGRVFKANKFNYHELDKSNNSKLKELSLILPEMLKYSIEEVGKIYDSEFQSLESTFKDTQKRVINNIAYAYTGAMLLLDISDVQIEGLSEKFTEYARKQFAKYENLKDIVEKVLAEIPVLAELKVVEKDTHFRLYTETNEGHNELHVRFHKSILISVINKFYSHDKSKHIDEELFTSYARKHPRFRGCKSVRYNSDNKPAHSMCFNVTDMEEYIDYHETPKPASYEELKECVEGNNM